MGKIKFGRVLGLAVLGVLSMMAMFAVSAQAAEFFIKKSDGTKTILLATLTGEQEGTGSLLVAGRNLKINCASGEVKTGSEINNANDGLAHILFKKCTALNLKTNAELPCTVDEPEALVLVLPHLDPNTGLPGVLFEPDPTGAEGKEGKFVTVKFLGESCPLPEQNPVTGTIVASIDSNDTVKPLLLMSEAIQKSAGAKLLFGGFEAFIDANATVQLTGVHAGLKFGVA